MNSSHPDDEMFDDLHQGVEALRGIATTRTVPFSQKAVASLQRLENTVPVVRNHFHVLKNRLTDSAMIAAQRTDRALHKHPWVFTLSALGLGLLTGLVLMSSGGEDEDG